jgi:hypothetical protein
MVRRQRAHKLRHLDDDVVLMFHDGFRLNAWKDSMRGPEYKNVVLDTHIYVAMADMFAPGEARGFELHRFMEAALVTMRRTPPRCGRFFPSWWASGA